MTLKKSDTLAAMTYASMRPGQEAPDDLISTSYTSRWKVGFNEAGARSPG